MKFVFCFVLFLWGNYSALDIPEDMTYIVETLNPSVDEKGHKIFEGDMVLTKEQQAIIENQTGDRAGKSILSYRWPNNTFLYTISPGLANEPNVSAAIRNWGTNTCVTFTKAGANTRAYAQIYRGEGCSATVGYLGRHQTISIGFDCNNLGTIEHEIGHALGVLHEQGRSDRDNYVVIFNENIQSGKEDEFKLETNISSYGIGYDLDSVMHYGSLDFSRDGGNTIVTKDPFNHFRIGQRDGMSFDDIKLVNFMYNCSGHCPNPPTCLNQGYVNKACRCVCPPGTSGRTCRTGRRTFPVLDCLHKLYTAGTISSPGFPNHVTNKIKSKCIWKITAPRRQRVRIHFSHFDLSTRQPSTSSLPNACAQDYLELRTDSETRGINYCVEELKNVTKTSTGNVLMMFYKASSNFEGFKADVSFF